MADITPRIVDCFRTINTVPRCSKNEARISAWLCRWAAAHGLDFQQDPAGNVVIRVPGIPQPDTAPIVVLQGHMDMVCEKSADSTHDFTTDAIQMTTAGEWLQATGTTLGADNGIALAMALTLAAESRAPRPPLELLFTVDEETGLTGAHHLEPGFIQGRTLLNLDSEVEGVLTVGCAGGCDTEITLPLTPEGLPADLAVADLAVEGLRGGHSGVDIHEQRANAIALLARCLKPAAACGAARLVGLEGGNAHNAIPRRAVCRLACRPEAIPELTALAARMESVLRNEYRELEPDLRVVLTVAERPGTGANGLSAAQSARVRRLLSALPHGVQGMSRIFAGLVETSANLATVSLGDRQLKVVTSQRSNVMSRLEEISAKIEAVSALAGARSIRRNAYPAWQPDMDSPLLDRCREVYQGLFQRAPQVAVIHAGLECAVIGDRFPGMDMISFGPTIENLHSPAERLHLPSLGRVWAFLSALLTALAPGAK
jgi:dipeptidase D